MPGQNLAQAYLPCMKTTRAVRVMVQPEDTVGPQGGRYFTVSLGPKCALSTWDLTRLKGEAEAHHGEHCRFRYYCTRTKRELHSPPRVIPPNWKLLKEMGAQVKHHA